MSFVPLEKNTVAITTLAMIAAVGLVVRLFVRIPIIPELLELTPGFMFSELGGVIGGIPGGILVGAIVGMGGAFSGGEIPVLPMIGNICLGLGTGLAIHVVRNRDSLKYAVIAILGGGIIGGFLPSMTIFAAITASFELTLIYALLDMFQAIIWAIAAIVVERSIVRPLIGHYLYTDMSETLGEDEVATSD